MLTIFGETVVRRCLAVFPDLESVGENSERYTEVQLIRYSNSINVLYFHLGFLILFMWVSM